MILASPARWALLTAYALVLAAPATAQGSQALPCNTYSFDGLASFEVGLKASPSAVNLGVRVVDVATGALIDARAVVTAGAPLDNTACGWIGDVGTSAPDPAKNYVWLKPDVLYRIEIYRDWSLYGTGGAVRIKAYEYFYHSIAPRSFFATGEAQVKQDVTIEVGPTYYASAVSNRLRSQGVTGSIENYFLDDLWIMPYNARHLCEQTQGGCDLEQAFYRVPFLAPVQSDAPGFPRTYQTTQYVNWTLPGTVISWSGAELAALRFAPGTGLTAPFTNFNVTGVTLTASNTSQGWRGVRFQQGSSGVWTALGLQPTVVERVAGDAGISCLTTPCSATAAVTVENAYINFNGVLINEPLAGTYLHGLAISGPAGSTTRNQFLSGLRVEDMSGSGIYAYAGARPRLVGNGVVLKRNAETALIASGSGTRPFLSSVQTPNGPRGPVFVDGLAGGVGAVALGRVTFGAAPTGTGLGYASITNNVRRGLSASGGGDLDAGTLFLHSRNVIMANWPTNATGNGLAAGTGSTVMARCNWWGTTDPAAFRVAAQSGAVFDAAAWLTGDPYDNTPDTCVDGDGTPDGRAAGSAVVAESRRGTEAGDGRGRTPPADRLSEAMEMRPVAAIAHLMALVRDHPDAPEAASALSLAGHLASAADAPPAAWTLLATHTGGDRAALRQAAHQALAVARHARGDTEGALASAAALVAMGGDAARTGRAAEVFVLADAERADEARAALAALEALAPGSEEAGAARAHLAARGVAVPETRAAAPDSAAPDAVEARAAEAFSVAVQPNPAAGEATVSVTLAEAGAVRLSVVDLLGREVAVLIDGAREAGTHTAPVAGLAPGVYTVRAVGAGARVATRLTVVRGPPLPPAAVCALLLWATGAVAQEPGWTSPVWEQMPLMPDRISQINIGLGFFTGDGTADPSLDTLVVFQSYGVFRYAPDEDNGEWGAWHRFTNAPPEDGLVTSDNTLIFATPVWRSTDRGRTWHEAGPPYEPVHETRLAWLRAQSGGRAVVLATGGAGDGIPQESHYISFADGEPGSWIRGGVVTVFADRIADVPESPGLPNGRLLHSGQRLLYSDDGAMSWRPVAMNGDTTQAYLDFSFAFLPREGHPFGGILFGLGCGEYFFCDSGGNYSGESAQMWRSDDGGATFTFVHQFTSAETGVPLIDGVGPQIGVPFVGPDGALWAGVSRRVGAYNPGHILRSTDEGVTWHHADTGLHESNGGRGWHIRQLVLARDGRMYAATDQGIWRTTQPIVAAESRPPPPPALTVAVAPNPSQGRATLTVEVPAAVAAARVDVFTSDGRILDATHDGPLSAGTHRFEVDTRGWAAGTYFVRVYNDGRQDTQLFTVVR